MTTEQTLSECTISVIHHTRNVTEAYQKLQSDMERAGEACRKVQEKRVG